MEYLVPTKPRISASPSHPSWKIHSRQINRCSINAPLIRGAIKYYLRNANLSRIDSAPYVMANS